MSKFITSSLWNFTANFLVRVMSILTFPFLVRYFLKEDISIFKSLQAFVLILLTIIPIGTNILYLSSPAETREKRWNLFFYVSLGIAMILSLLLLANESITSFFIKHHIGGELRILLIIFPLIEGVKVLAVTKLSSLIDFKGISIALIIKQLLLYTGIILFAFIKPTLAILIAVVFLSELLELFMLLIHARRLKIKLTPYSDEKMFLIDNTAKKYLLFSGTEQILLTFAMQFPTIFVVIVMGQALAPEFQLPFSAVALPVSLVMTSVARVSFPHYSNLRDNEKISNSLISLLFPVTFILFPVLLGIHFFAREITHLFFDQSWQYAIFALQAFPLLMVAYILGVPSTFISNIKERPQINLFYSISLLVSRLLTIYLGFRIGGFYGTIVFFILGDIIVRFVRLKIDMGLLAITLRHFLFSIRFNFLCSLLMLLMMWSLHFLIDNKIISFAVALSVSFTLNLLFERKRCRETFNRLRGVLWK